MQKHSKKISLELDRLRRVEKELRQSEDRYRMLVEQSPDSILIHNLEGKILFTNASRVGVLGGQTPDDIIGRNAMEFVHPDDLEFVQGAIKEALEDYKNKRFSIKTIEHRFTRLDGSVFYGEATGVPFVYEGELAIQVIVRDITKRKEAEGALNSFKDNLECMVKERTAKLSTANELLQNVINTSQDLIFVKDAQLRTILCNNVFAQALGKKPEELYGRTDIENGWSPDLVWGNPEKGIRGFEADDREALAGKTVYNPSDPANVKGEIRIFDTKKMPLRDEGGKVIGVLGISRDITDRKRTEEALKFERERLYSILDLFPGFVYLQAPDHSIRFANHRFIEEYGDPGDRPCYEVMWGRNEPCEVCPTFRVFDTKRPEVWVSDHTTHDRIYQVYDEPFIDSDGSKLVLEFSIDITEQKRAEEEKEGLQEQLVQAQKMEAVGTLAGGVAHDFNNIMTAIKNLNSLAMSKTGEKDLLKKYLEPIRDVSDRAINLVQQLLIFSEGKSVKLVTFNLNDTIDNLLDMLISLVSEDISIEKDLGHGLWNIDADKGRVEQVITNLIVNGRDAMPQGGKITLRTENFTLTEEQSLAIQGATPGNFVCLTIKDTGTGIDEDTIGHIFEPFFTTRFPNGTGLGLSVVYGIVRDLNGWMDVTSEPGQGAKFRVCLRASTKSREVAVEEPIKRKAIDGEGKRILLVEDDKWVRKSTAMVLSENGYEVFEAANAEIAISIFYREKGRFDLVLSDVVMPGKNGLQMIDPFLDINHGISILLFSSYLDNKVQMNQIIKRGFAYIQKPYETTDLLKAVEETIAQES